MEAIILAGGLGTRLKSAISEIPKSMAPISNHPFLYYIFKWLEKNQITRIILSVGYKWEVIYNEFGEYFNSIELVYSIESSPLGTGGAIALAMKKLKKDQFLIINGDTMFDVDIEQFVSFHKFGEFDFSIILKHMKKIDRYGTVELNDNNRISCFKNKALSKKGYINGGVYIANTSIRRYFPNSQRFSFEQEFLEKMVSSLKFGGFIKDDYFIDIGVPEDYKRAQKEFHKLLD